MMSTIDIGRPPRQYRGFKNFIVILMVAALVVGGYFVVPKFEWNAPQITLTPDRDTIGLSPIDIAVTEQGTGLKSFAATLTSGGSEQALASEQFVEPLTGKKFTLALSSKLTGVKEGPAVLRISAKDRSLWNFFRGNETVVQKNVTIDITPPTVEVLADDAYINFGGSGLVAYKPSTDTVTSGVKIGDYFFPGYKGQTKDPAVFLVFFAHPYNLAEDEKAVLVATDQAGNTRQLRLSYSLKDVRYKKSTITITDDFIQGKVAPLLNDVGARQGSSKDIFVRVNRDLRKENEDKIRAIGQKTTASILWRGPFVQLSNSKVEANFADARTYIYDKQIIDTAYHLGFDLSVTKRYPVEAANSGVVNFVGDLGIYGNTVVIDHGLGLATLYSHLSSIEVKEGDRVELRQIIGKTGETGLAVGDHLHFATLLHGVPVLPKEWWDAKWIRDNIQPKLDQSLAAGMDQAQSAARPRRRRR